MHGIISRRRLKDQWYDTESTGGRFCPQRLTPETGHN